MTNLYLRTSFFGQSEKFVESQTTRSKETWLVRRRGRKFDLHSLELSPLQPGQVPFIVRPTDEIINPPSDYRLPS